MLLWGSLLVVSAVYMGALRDLPVEASGWSRLWKGLGLVLLIYGALMLVGAACFLLQLAGMTLLTARAVATGEEVL